MKTNLSKIRILKAETAFAKDEPGFSMVGRQKALSNAVEFAYRAWGLGLGLGFGAQGLD